MPSEHDIEDESPEAALALARHYLRSGPDPGAWPRWRAADLPVPVRIAWLRAEIARRPGTVRDEPAGELLYQAVHGLAAADAEDGERLVRDLSDRAEPLLHAEALRLAREAVRAGLLAPDRARTLLLGLLTDASTPDVIAGALRELAQPWAALEPLPGRRFLRFLDQASTADAALEAAARHGHRDLLLDMAADPERPPVPRRRALELLGGLASRDDTGHLVEIAGEDPLLLAGPAVQCLLEMHQRGHFPGDGDVPGIVDLALADHSVDADDVATLLYTSRHAMLREVASAAPDDTGWPRRLELLIALAAQGTGELPIGEGVTGLLPAVPDPAPFLEALRALRHTGAEEAVLAVLPRSPAAALDALEAVGGERTAAVLREGLDQVDTAAHLLPVRHRALELLWHLTDDPGSRGSLLARLDPRDLPARIAPDLGGPDARELELLRAGLDPDKPAEALCRLARTGGAGTVPAIADLLLNVVAREREVPDEVLSAVRDLGGRLYGRGKIRPRCLLDAADAREAGDALLASIVLDLLDDDALGPAEQAILLELLLDVPYRETRARVHRLLRHRDRHVRKHAIALLARDGGGRNARALAASLIPLTRASDVQTVRQAVLALRDARVRGAAVAIADCLDHPNMNIKKTAAEALVLAGTPAAVPKLLFWLGRHDNPGLRQALSEALRAVLGDVHRAVIVAAADRAADERTRSLLVQSIDGRLTESAVRVLAAQGSPAGEALLRLLPDRPPGPSKTPLDELAERGWDSAIARQVVDLHEEDPDAPAFQRTGRLRPMLAHWLDLAATGGTGRAAVLRLTLRLCPPPWSMPEREIFARRLRTLAEGAAGIGDAHRERLLAMIEEAVPLLPVEDGPEFAPRIRGLPPMGRPVLALLRRCGAVLTRDDLDQALAAARNGPDPWLAEESVLREAFEPAPRPEEGHGLTSRERLEELITAFPTAPADAREGLLERMLELQPLGTPPWVLAEDAGRTAPEVRAPRSGDLDQPRSAAQRDRLLAMLDDPERSATAARALLDWPEPGIRAAVLRAFLDGRVDLPITAPLAGALRSLSETEMREAADGARERIAQAAGRLEPPDRARFLPLLLEWWETGGSATRLAAERALRGADPDLLAGSLAERLEAGAWGVLDLVKGVPLRRTPSLSRAYRRLEAEGRADLADGIVLVDGPFRPPGAERKDAAALAALRDRTRVGETRQERPSRESLLASARTGTAEEVRAALTLLAEAHDEVRSAGGRDPGLEELLGELIGHSAPAVRLHAHRISRRVLDRPAYLELTSRLLDDGRADLARTAIRTLSHAGWRPAIPALVGLLADTRVPVRKEAGDGLVRYGAAAIPALKHAAGRARPDRRPLYTAVLEQISAPS
ncbi:HEAT repeat domain-containing protein [Actinomadura sp. 9N407]|uniref:HEAT repeat domain-containing protein n=1 Tax=Actinomadura sp. 9N407 TaxID=3375154 RepID=UPI0037B299DC